MGMVTLLRGMFALFGEYNYQSFRYFLVFLLPLLVLSGDRIVRFFSGEDIRAECYYLLFSLFCIPIYPYLNFIYGDLIATVMGTFSVWMYLSCMKRFSWGRLLLFALAAGAAVVLKKNFLILAIALMIVMLCKVLFEWSRRNLLIMATFVAGIVLMNAAVWYTYRNIRPDKAWAVPGLLWVVMGLNDEGVNPGWYNDYSLDTFEAAGDDAAVAKQKAWEDLRDKIDFFIHDPVYMADFFARKVNSQWNAPMYQCVVMNGNVDREKLLFPASDLYRGTRVGKGINYFMEVYQMFMYGSILLWLVLCRKEIIRIEKYVLLIAIFGGFIFSVIWEAKARYVLPYLFMQVPYMALATKRITVFLDGSLKKYRRK